MHYYLIIFSDWSETVGKQTSRAAMERDARIYCEKWNLSETVREVREITPEEYSSRTGQPIKEEKKPEKKSNRIPRVFYRITARQLVESSGGKAGDVWHIYRNESGLLGLNTTTGKYYCLFASHLRNPDFYEFLSIDKPEKAQDGHTSPATVSDKETGKDDAGTTRGAYIVQCKRPRGSWTDYSSPATLEECETIKARAEARRTCDTAGNLLLYRVVTASDTPETPHTATTDADKETPTATHTEPLRATETATEAEETTSAPEEAAQTEIRTTEGTTEEQTRPESIQTEITTDGPTTPGKAADDQSTPGQTTITDTTKREDKPGTAGHDKTTGRRTTSRTTTRESPTSAQTAPQRHATEGGGQTTTKRAKSPPRAAKRATAERNAQENPAFSGETKKGRKNPIPDRL